MKSQTSLVNVVVFAICVSLISMLLLPAIARHRAVARGSFCGNNLKQIGLAIHNYHSAFKQLPMVCGGTVGNEDEALCNQGRLSGFMGLLPFVEQQRLWEMVSNPYQDPGTGKLFPSMGPVPWYDPNVYRPWSMGPDVFRCPDDGDKKPVVADKKPKIVYTLKPVDAAVGPIGLRSNYVFSYGDGTHDIGTRLEYRKAKPQEAMRYRASQRGFFMPGNQTRFRDILDGLSNTLMVSETRASVVPKAGTRILKGIAGLSDQPSLCLKAAKDPGVEFWNFARGGRWTDGLLPITGFQTVLPPNSPSCTDDTMFNAIASASSQHDGGVNVLMGDGSVSFVSNEVDCGDPDVPGVHIQGGNRSAPGMQSPYGVWGALGSRANKELVDYESLPVAGSGGGLGFGFAGNNDEQAYRTWHDRSGKISLSAKFNRIIDKKTIELEDRSGVLHQVPLNTLKDKDIYHAVSSELLAQ